MGRKPFSAVFFLAGEWISVHCVYVSSIQQSVTTAVDTADSTRMLGTMGDCSAVRRLIPGCWPREALMHV